ncbi:hypothetical protein [Yoonia sp. BS5-3]|uniref:Uncharacterized protein n=1 Tax=Yoonia phaeophyticola TaxID=3137369 RepID=A0ABZ2V1D7_9RHOB
MKTLLLFACTKILLGIAAAQAQEQVDLITDIETLSRTDFAPRLADHDSPTPPPDTLDLADCTLTLNTIDRSPNGQFNYRIADIPLETATIQIFTDDRLRPYEFYSVSLDYPDGTSRPSRTGVITFQLQEPIPHYVFLNLPIGTEATGLNRQDANQLLHVPDRTVSYTNQANPRETDIAALAKAILSYQSTYCTERQ